MPKSLAELLAWGPITHTRRNHALEHATLQMLARANPSLRLAGYSDWQGFWVLGAVSTDALSSAVEEALGRLRNGEFNLAVHPFCGTNFLVSGVLAGTAAWLGMLGAGSGFKRKFDRLPVVILLATAALMLGMPLGPLLQARVTTLPQLGNLQVVRVEKRMRRGVPLHRVVTRD